MGDGFLCMMTWSRSCSSIPLKTRFRVVSRLERTLADVEDLAAQWALVPGEKWTEGQKARVQAAVAGLEAQLAALRAGAARSQEVG